MPENAHGSGNRSMALQTQEVYFFGPFAFDPSLRVVRREATILPLTGKELSILLALVSHGAQHPGKVLSKQELQDQVWSGDEIGDSNF